MGITSKTNKNEPEKKGTLKYPAATLLERTAVKQLPILLELLGRIVKETTPSLE